MKTILFSLLLTLSFFDANAQSQSKKPKKTKVKKKKVINFDDQLVEGQTKAPDLFYLLEKKQFNYKRLIKLRENFHPEMTANAEDLGEEGKED